MLANPARILEPTSDLALHGVSAGLSDSADSFRTRVPRRVALFTETFLPRVDGIVNTLCWTLRGLIEAGCEPLVVAPRGNAAMMPGVRVLAASSMTFPLYTEVRLALMGPGICQKLDRFRPEV